MPSELKVWGGFLPSKSLKLQRIELVTRFYTDDLMSVMHVAILGFAAWCCSRLFPWEIAVMFFVVMMTLSSSLHRIAWAIARLSYTQLDIEIAKANPERPPQDAA